MIIAKKKVRKESIDDQKIHQKVIKIFELRTLIKKRQISLHRKSVKRSVNHKIDGCPCSLMF